MKQRIIYIIIGVIAIISFSIGYNYIIKLNKEKVYNITSEVLQEHSNLEEVYIKDNILYIKLNHVDDELAYIENYEDEYNIEYYTSKKLKKIFNVDEIKLI